MKDPPAPGEGGLSHLCPTWASETRSRWKERKWEARTDPVDWSTLAQTHAPVTGTGAQIGELGPGELLQAPGKKKGSPPKN